MKAVKFLSVLFVVRGVAAAAAAARVPLPGLPAQTTLRRPPTTGGGEEQP
jgi:hypothetical protein